MFFYSLWYSQAAAKNIATDSNLIKEKCYYNSFTNFLNSVKAIR